MVYTACKKIASILQLGVYLRESPFLLQQTRMSRYILL